MSGVCFYRIFESNLSSFALWKTSSFVILSVHCIFNIHLELHVSNALTILSSFIPYGPCFWSTNSNTPNTTFYKFLFHCQTKDKALITLNYTPVLCRKRFTWKSNISPTKFPFWTHRHSSKQLNTLVLSWSEIFCGLYPNICNTYEPLTRKMSIVWLLSLIYLFILYPITLCNFVVPTRSV